MKTSVILVLILLLMLPGLAVSQDLDFSPKVNFSSNNNFAPTIDGIGKTVLFLSDYTQDGFPWYYFSKRTSSWSQAEPLPKNLGPGRLIYQWGHSLNFEGDVFYFTTTKSGMGGYDMWYSTWEDGSWSYAKSMNTPVNTPGHEGSPSVSPDGRTLYFIRCEDMSMNNASGCKIFRAERIDEDKWSEPVELPAKINSGNTLSPRILPNNKTLIFSSNRPGGKGGYDLYQTDLENDEWTDPVNLSYVNTKDDEISGDISMIGAAMVIGRLQDNNKRKLVRARIPLEFQPNPAMFIKGKFEENSRSRVLLYRPDTPTDIFNELTQSDSMMLILPKGGDYVFVSLPAQTRRKIMARSYKTDELRISRIFRENWDNSQPEKGDIEVLEGLNYLRSVPYISDRADILLMLSRQIMANPQLKYTIGLNMKNYREDSIQSDIDLTEVRIDSVERKYFELVAKPDSLLSIIDTLNVPPDSILAASLIRDTTVIQADTLMSNLDSDTLNNPVITQVYDTLWITEYDITYIYHNDRSSKEAKELQRYFEESGIPPHRYEIVGVRVEEENDYLNRYITIKYE